MKWLEFKKLLHWFCETELDQWVRWKIKTKFGYVFIEISRHDDGFDHEELKEVVQ